MSLSHTVSLLWLTVFFSPSLSICFYQAFQCNSESRIEKVIQHNAIAIAAAATTTATTTVASKEQRRRISLMQAHHFFLRCNLYRIDQLFCTAYHCIVSNTILASPWLIASNQLINDEKETIGKEEYQCDVHRTVNGRCHLIFTRIR